MLLMLSSISTKIKNNLYMVVPIGFVGMAYIGIYYSTDYIASLVENFIKSKFGSWKKKPVIKQTKDEIISADFFVIISSTDKDLGNETMKIYNYKTSKAVFYKLNKKYSKNLFGYFVIKKKIDIALTKYLKNNIITQKYVVFNIDRCSHVIEIEENTGTDYIIFNIW